MTTREPDRFDAKALELLRDDCPHVLREARAWIDKHKCCTEERRALVAKIDEALDARTHLRASMVPEIPSADAQAGASAPCASCVGTGVASGGAQCDTCNGVGSVKPAAAPAAETRPTPEEVDRALHCKVLAGGGACGPCARILIADAEAKLQARAAPAADYDPITAPIPAGDMNGPHGPLPAAETLPMGTPRREAILREHGQPAPAAETGKVLTNGQRAQVSVAAHRQRLKVLFDENERRPLPDTALRGALLDADRFANELCAIATAPIATAQGAEARDAEWIEALRLYGVYLDGGRIWQNQPSGHSYDLKLKRLLAARGAPIEGEGK